MPERVAAAGSEGRRFAGGGDFLDWQANVGTGNPTNAVAADTAVSEPASALLLASGCGFAGRRKI